MAADAGLDGISVHQDTIERVDPDSGEQLWKVVHASVWETVQREKQQFELTEPVRVDDHLYYGVRSWLIELDSKTGVIQTRHWFPATIASVEREAEELRVTVEHDDLARGDGTHRVTFRWRPGTASPQEIWSLVGFLGVWKDASYLAPKSTARSYEDGEFQYPDYAFEEIERDIARLRERRAQEPSNPFYDYILGRVHERAGDDKEARAAYERSLAVEGAHWSTWVQLAAWLDGVARHDLADRAFAQAKALIEGNERIHVRRWSSQLVNMILLGVGMRSRLDYAVRHEEFEQVERMHSRIAWMFPHIEHGATAWRIAADWHAAHGRPEAAQRWRSHAERAAKSAWIPLENAYEPADLSLVLLGGLALGIWVAVFVIAVRRARQGSRGWLPRPTAAEIVGLVLAFLAPLPLFWTAQVSVEKIGHLGQAPVEVFLDGWTSPNARAWLEGLEPSRAHEELTAQVEAISEARLAGEAPPIEPPDVSLVVDAIEADARHEAWRQLTTHLQPEMLADRGFSSGGISMPGWLVGVVFWLLLGGFLGHRFPRFQTATRYAVPGGARSASFLTPFLLAAIFAAVGALAWDFDSILERLSQPAFGAYFGLESVYEADDFGQTNMQWFFVLGGVLILHLATLWRDRRVQSAAEKEESEGR